MKNILIIGKKSKQAFENLKKISHKKINKTLEDYIKFISKNKKRIIQENTKDVKKFGEIKLILKLKKIITRFLI